MNREDIIRMAQEEWLSEHGAIYLRDGGNVEINIKDLERFAALVAEHEREACAKVCDEREYANLYGVRECAAAIRARNT